ncbi:MAG: ubiE [Gammaproteobacteria bacterium]|jgi:demethylmenaquinone methyltransferase/2-methoxy-6-polyprenyl-1,4-benzoquinol methylase|nr:ubiE [Gammaproteobacteria bacterium]
MKQTAENKEKTTHFGYKRVLPAEKTKLVEGVFDSVAEKYNLMNDLMSLGIHRLWKQFTLSQSGAKEGHCVLDLAGGTGDLTRGFSKRIGNTGFVILGDINGSMLQTGRKSLENKGIIHNVSFAQLDAQTLPFADNTFDIISIAFGLRNVTDIPLALNSMQRVLKPGGQLLVLEFSKPRLAPLKTLYDAYSFSVLPKLGEWIANDSESYRYLAESIRMHPDQTELQAMILQAGFDTCDYHNLCGGIVALHTATKY